MPVTDTIIRAATHVVSRVILGEERAFQKKVGYVLEFRDLPKDWLNGYAMVDLTFTWRAYGLPVRGLNYFTVGAIDDGRTSRYDIHDDLYQAWLGGYVFQSKKPLTWHNERYVRLAEADQKGWLKRFGDDHPKMEFAKPKMVKELQVEGHPAYMYSWEGVTRSDVGATSHSLLTKVMMDGMAEMMNALTPGLSVKGENFIPPTPARTPNEELLISGYTIIIHIDSRTKAVLYVCMVGENAADRHVMKKLITENVRLIKKEA